MDKFCLKWNDYEKNLGTAFNDLREQKELFNVSLISEDGSQVEAHKVVLSACSPFFRNIITRNAQHPHPLLFLKGVRHRDLVSLLDFMYRGQVNIAQEDLSTFLSVAEELKVKGLTQDQKTQTTSPSSSNIEKIKNKAQTPQVKLALPRPPPPYRPPVPVSMPQLMPSASNTKPASFPPDDEVKCLGEGSNLSAVTKPMEKNTEDDDTLINVVDTDTDPTDEHSIDPVAPRNEEGASLVQYIYFRMSVK